MAKQTSLILSHWYNLIEQLPHSPQQFYESLEEAIKRRQLQNISISRITYSEGGIFSAKREYLRVGRKEHLFDVCAAPYGKGFFVSWWLGESTGGIGGLLLIIPFIGPALARMFRPETYYRVDTALMFQESIHQAVLEVIDGMTKQNGLRSLSELERRPILDSLFKK